MGFTFIGGTPSPVPYDFPSSMSSGVGAAAGGGFGNLINIQVLTGSGTFAATAGAKSSLVQLCGAGGGGSGCAATTTGVAAGGPGGSGGTVYHYFRVSINGVSYSVGAAGTVGAAGGIGGTGGATTFSTLTANGGAGGSQQGGGAATLAVGGSGVGGGAAGGNILNSQGNQITYTLAVSNAGLILNALGDPSLLGGNVFGSGGTGSVVGSSSAAQPGGSAGKAGTIIVFEYA